MRSDERTHERRDRIGCMVGGLGNGKGGVLGKAAPRCDTMYISSLTMIGLSFA